MRDPETEDCDDENDEDARLAKLSAAAAQCIDFYRENWNAAAYRTGPLRLDEWRGQWRSRPDDPFLEPSEDAEAWGDLYETIHSWGHVGNDYYLMSYRPGDRTLYLSIVKPSLLNGELIQRIQTWLRGFPRYRVLLDLELDDDDVVMVYPDAVRVPLKYGDDIPTALALMSAKAQARKQP